MKPKLYIRLIRNRKGDVVSAEFVLDRSEHVLTEEDLIFIRKVSEEFKL